MYPLNLVSEVIFLVMTPLTRPASEFHLTWSPMLNTLGIEVAQRHYKMRSNLSGPLCRRLSTPFWSRRYLRTYKRQQERGKKHNSASHVLQLATTGLAPVFVANLLILGSGPACDMLQCIVSR